jgi:hypothetical protein
MMSFPEAPRDEVVDFSWQCIRVERTRPGRNKFLINQIWIVYFAGVTDSPVRRLNMPPKKWAAKFTNQDVTNQDAANQDGRIEGGRTAGGLNRNPNRTGGSVGVPVTGPFYRGRQKRRQIF